ISDCYYFQGDRYITDRDGVMYYENDPLDGCLCDVDDDKAELISYDDGLPEYMIRQTSTGILLNYVEVDRDNEEMVRKEFYPNGEYYTVARYELEDDTERGDLIEFIYYWPNGEEKEIRDEDGVVSEYNSEGDEYDEDLIDEYREEAEDANN
ncbi:MAG: hypothetical protein ACO3AY_07910, partial [Chitinophagaceae bacterium]